MAIWNYSAMKLTMPSLPMFQIHPFLIITSKPTMFVGPFRKLPKPSRPDGLKDDAVKRSLGPVDG